MFIALWKAMKVLDGEPLAKGTTPWTIGTEDGNGWIFYFDGEKLHDGSHNHVVLSNEVLNRQCIGIYERGERERYDEYDNFMELKAGLAFIVEGRENGEI